MREKRGWRYNATQHGAYSESHLETEMFGENEGDFEALHQECVLELQPNGLLEEETVYAVASYTWRKKRVQRLFAAQLDWLKTPPEWDDVDKMLGILISIKQIKSYKYAYQLLSQVPLVYKGYFDTVFKYPESGNEEAWLEELKAKMHEAMIVHETFLLNELATPKFKAESSARIQEALLKLTAVEERLDWMIDKALKRLANLKLLKRFDIAKPESRQKLLETRSPDNAHRRASGGSSQEAQSSVRKRKK